MSTPKKPASKKTTARKPAEKKTSSQSPKGKKTVEPTVVETPPLPAPEPKPEIYYAGFDVRVLATMIDLTLMFFVVRLASVVVYPVTFHIYQLADVRYDAAAYNSRSKDVKAMLEMVQLVQETGLGYKLFVDFWITLAIFACAILPFWYNKAATPGKMLTGIRIADVKTLAPPSNTQLTLRYAAYVVSLLPCMLGFFTIWFNRRRRGWHDVLAGTVVIHNRKPWIKRFAGPSPRKVLDLYKDLLSKKR